MAKKVAPKRPAHRTLHLEYTGEAARGKRALITHVFLDVEGQGRQQVPIGTPHEVLAEHADAYLAAALPPGYEWKGRSSAPPSAATRSGGADSAPATETGTAVKTEETNSGTAA